MSSNASGHRGCQVSMMLSFVIGGLVLAALVVGGYLVFVR